MNKKTMSSRMTRLMGHARECITDEKLKKKPSKVKQAKEDDEHIVPHTNMPLVFTSLMLAMFFVTTALPTIVTDLGGGNSYSWVGSAYLLAAATLSLAYGKLSDPFGGKKVFSPSIVIFMVGSALCGAARSMTGLFGPYITRTWGWRYHRSANIRIQQISLEISLLWSISPGGDARSNDSIAAFYLPVYFQIRGASPTRSGVFQTAGPVSAVWLLNTPIIDVCFVPGAHIPVELASDRVVDLEQGPHRKERTDEEVEPLPE
ncbi:hypothetical protein B0H13DRAFT_1878320 [Mycena leptocephala]|nr:hypothetical protein B0H13DRAFT_1878320 [Mycena leptocephala]